MKFEKKNLSKTEVEFEIEVSAEEFKRFIDKAVLELGKDLEIKGFRKGKAPRSVIEEYFGSEKILIEAADLAVNQTYRQAVLESELDALFNPEIKVKKMAKGDKLVYTAKTVIIPKIELPDYKKIASKVKINPVQVKEEEIEKTLDWLKKTKGQTEINDDFARSLGKFENLESLKNSIKQGIILEKEQAETQRVRQEILEEISKKIDINLPDSLIEQEQEQMLQELKNQVSRAMKIPFPEYLKKVNKKEEEILDSLKQEAKRKIKRFFILREIGKKENIQVSDQEVTDEVNKTLGGYSSLEQAEKNLGIDLERFKDYTREVIRNEKIFKILTQNIC